MNEITIRPLRSPRELRRCEALQREVWGMPELEVVPDYVLLTAAEGGGAVLGAFAGEELVGFVLSFVGLSGEGELRHLSLMAGVKEEWRDKGLGYRLKLAQREHALQQGIGLITWTFDPLESRNAHFNLNKLGGIAREYLPEYYGELRDARNRGLPADRLLCEWHLNSPRVEARIRGQRPGLPSGPVVNPGDGERLSPVRKDLEEPVVLVEIPADLQALKARSPKLAREWRFSCREALSHYLGVGYVVTGLLRREGRSFLVLENRDPGEILSEP
ncbi:hypothetical protein J7L84_02895 [Candidatus Bipolaricaulota bacterium]|nr:hypothetical protein [Candidatus Bipolaricaulota bacterium]